MLLFWQWENHAKSLKLEEQAMKKIRARIEEKVMDSSGTWIDWQYLLDSAMLLKKVGLSPSTPPPLCLTPSLSHTPSLPLCQVALDHRSLALPAK